MKAQISVPVAVSPSTSFGATLKRFRRAAGLTQESLAERAGYSVGHVSKLESSVRKPVPATVELLAEALDLSPAERGVLERSARHTGSFLQVAPTAQAAASLPLLGRAVEEAALERHLEGDGQPPLLLFAGEPGMGKTRLLREACVRAGRGGWSVVEGECRRQGAHSPYDPLVDALAGVVRRYDPSQLRTALEGCSWLVRLVPELLEITSVPVPAWSLPADQERRLMFSAVERFLRNIAGPAGTLLVLDNLHRAGADALDLLSSLVHAAPRSPLRFVGAYCHSAVRSGDPLNALLGELAQERLVVRHQVSPLTPSDAARLFDTLLAGADHVDDPTRAQVLAKAEGVPFVLESYAQWLRSRALQEREDSALDIPWDVTQTVRRRVDALSETARAVVRIAAVAEGDDARELLIGVARQLGYSEQDILSAIDEACAAGVLVPRGENMYAFAYDIIGEVVERTLGMAERAHLHGMIAEWLENERPRAPVEALANHYERAGGAENTLLFLERTAARAEALHAYADAERYYRSLVQRLETQGDMGGAAEAREHLGSMLCFQGQYDEAMDALERALAEYRARGWHDGQVRVAAQIGLVHVARRDFVQGIARLKREAADAERSPDASTATLYMSLSQLYNAAGRYGKALESAVRAATLARASDDPRLLARTEMEHAKALSMVDRLDEGLRVLEDVAIPLTEASGDGWSEALALERAALTRIQRGEFQQARSDIKRGLDIGWRLDDSVTAARMILARGILCFHTGAWRQAKADLRWASTMLAPHQFPSHAATAAAWLGRLALAQGHETYAAATLHQSLVVACDGDDAQPVLIAHCALAERELLRGMSDEAHLRLEPLLANRKYRASDVTEVLALLAWATLENGEQQRSEALVTASVMRASALGLQCALTDALRVRAMVLAYAGRTHDASAGLDEAVALARSLGYPYAEGKALAASGRLLVTGGDTARGQERLAAAHALLRHLGERLYAESASPTGVVDAIDAPERR